MSSRNTWLGLNVSTLRAVMRMGVHPNAIASFRLDVRHKDGSQAAAAFPVPFAIVSVQQEATAHPGRDARAVQGNALESTSSS